MLGTLLKYDFKALIKVMLPLQLGVLIAGIVGTACLNFAFRSISASRPSSYSSYSSSSYPAYASNPFDGLPEILAMMVAVLLLSAVFISGFVTLILIARHIYKNFYSSEGYLTFTLPVTMNQHLFSKVISGITWVVINGLIITLTFILIIFFGFTTDGFFNTDVARGFDLFFSEVLGPLAGVLILELCVVTLLSGIMNVLQIVFSIVIGGAIARTHKVLAAIGFFLISGFAIAVLSTIFMFIVGLFQNAAYSSVSDSYAFFVAMQPSIIGSVLLYAGISLAFFFISKTSLKNSLNLD